jgi:hypothetical protein
MSGILLLMGSAVKHENGGVSGKFEEQAWYSYFG